VTHHKPALSQISLTEYFVSALVRLHSATWLYVSIARL
jgi:hypothetical protein